MEYPRQLFPEPPEIAINRLLSVAGNSTVATAESCTGGNVAGKITSVAGSSVYFLGGLVAYDNGVKTRLLGVAESLLTQFGAVSTQCAKAMAEGARELFGTDFAVSTTGIAGPGGGSKTKPVGLVYIGIASSLETLTFEFQFVGDRAAIVNQATNQALGALQRVVETNLAPAMDDQQTRRNR